MERKRAREIEINLDTSTLNFFYVFSLLNRRFLSFRVHKNETQLMSLMCIYTVCVIERHHTKNVRRRRMDDISNSSKNNYAFTYETNRNASSVIFAKMNSIFFVLSSLSIAQPKYITIVNCGDSRFFSLINQIDICVIRMLSHSFSNFRMAHVTKHTFIHTQMSNILLVELFQRILIFRNVSTSLLYALLSLIDWFNIY